MKKICIVIISNMLIANLYCASEEKKPLSLPSEISNFVDCAYRGHMQSLFNKLQEPRYRIGAFFNRDASQAYMAFLNTGPRNVMHNFPALVTHADTLQQTMLDDEASAVSPLMHKALESKKDPTFWECLHTTLRITLKNKVKGITIYPTDLETLEQNAVTSEDPEKKSSTERQPDFVGALIVMIRMMEFNYQQDPEAFKALFQ